MDFKDYKRFTELLNKYLPAQINERWEYLREATEQQQKDLFCFILYCRGNQMLREIISSTLLHDIKGTISKDPYFMAKSSDYSKQIILTKL